MRRKRQAEREWRNLYASLDAPRSSTEAVVAETFDAMLAALDTEMAARGVTLDALREGTPAALALARWWDGLEQASGVGLGQRPRQSGGDSRMWALMPLDDLRSGR
jgi:hypothetical protein